MNMNTSLSPNWASLVESRKAWMSVRDADLLENIMIRKAELNSGKPLQVIEWGGGRSTLWYTEVLEQFQIPYRWLCLESNRQFFDTEVRSELERRRNARILYAEHANTESVEMLKHHAGVSAVVFDYGLVMPFESGLLQDRQVNMDAYVFFPRTHGFQCDLAIIDGRKRRRCVIEAGKIMRLGGLVMLHDAWRKYYDGSFHDFFQSRRVGDEWMIGSDASVDFAHFMPTHAFENHVEFEVFDTLSNAQ